MKNNYVAIVLCVIFVNLCIAQQKNINGQLIANGDVEGIHILNRNAVKYTVSNNNGGFQIPAQINDTLTISGLKYITKTVIVTKESYNTAELKITLVERVNQLREVKVGDFLTGSLQSDMENSTAKADVNFYDLGIPGYTGKQLTQNERRLYDADGGSWGYVGLGFGLDVFKVLNTISGRTKRLKKIVALERKKTCLHNVRVNYETLILKQVNLTENQKNEYFYYCDEHPEFIELCAQKNDLAIIEFLQEKLQQYLKIINYK